MKILYLTDTHLTSKSPAGRIDNYANSSLKKLLEIGKIIKDNNINVVIHGGDMFHTPKVNLKYANLVITIIKQWNIPIYVVPGNHDLYGYNINTLDQTMLGVLYSSGIIKILSRSNPLEITTKNNKILIEGQEYYQNINQDMNKDFSVNTSGYDYNILVSHSMITPKPFIKTVSHNCVNDIKTDANLVLCGHYHDPFSLSNKDGTIFLNPGSLMRVERTRKQYPKVDIIEFTEINGTLTAKFYERTLKSSLSYDKVFDINAKNIGTSNNIVLINNFKNNINKLSNISTNVNYIKIINQLAKDNNLEQEVIKETIKYISDAQLKNNDNDNDIQGFISKNTNLYISSVELNNFQSYEHTVIKFNDKLNVLVGESGCGKSAVLRAIKWCLFNEPKGIGFIRAGKNSCSVKVTFNDNSSIERTKTDKSSGEYIVCDRNGNTQTFKGFGSEVPIDVINQHQMPEIYLTKDKKVKLNFCEQLDSPFLLGESPSVRASAIGKLTGGEVLDYSIRMINIKKKTLSKENNIYKKQLKELELEKDKYKNLDNIKLFIKILNIYKKNIDSLNDQIKILNDLKSKRNLLNAKINLCKQKLINISKVIQIKKYINYILNQINLIKNMNALSIKNKNNKNKILYLEHKISKYSSLQKVYKSILFYVNECDDIILMKQKYDIICNVDSTKDIINNRLKYYNSIIQIRNSIDIISSNIKKINDLFMINASYNSLKNNLTKQESIIDEISNKLNILDNKYKNIEKDFDDYIKDNPICPLCNNKIDKNTMMR